jgi:delta(3,5)-delta(2,4)-dienoyl-CoA isomerase
VDVGLAADIGGNQMLPKIVGNDSLLRELMLSARPMHAAEALQFGLVSRVLQDKEALMVCALGASSLVVARCACLVISRAPMGSPFCGA